MKTKTCQVCKVKHKKNYDNFKEIKSIVVCEDCYQEIFRLSKIKKLSFYDTCIKYRKLIQKMKLNKMKELNNRTTEDIKKEKRQKEEELKLKKYIHVMCKAKR